MDLGLESKRAIVTGASRGIGYETARLFLEEGARVLICARDGEKLDAAREALEKATGGEVHAVQADMSKEADVARVVDAARQRLGGVDPDVGVVPAQPSPDADERPTGAEAGDEDIDLGAVRDDLLRRRLLVREGVLRVPVLVRHDVARLPRGELLRELDGAVRAEMTR